MKKIFLITMSIFSVLIAKAQKDSIQSGLSFSGYAELYYTYDFNKPQDHNRPNFAYSYSRHNETTLNLGFIKASYQKENIRANLALMAGTYANANLAAEAGVFKNIFEANAGVKLSKKNNLWLDAGIFASHIGFESAIGKDCWNLTRSILADNSPYYESGVKLSYTADNGKWFLSALLLNGWQRIQRVDGNNSPAFGHQLIYKPTDKITLNSSSFIGNDKPDTAKQMRYFHNLYGQFQITNRLGLITGFDIGAEQKTKGSSQYNSWYSPVLIMKYSIDTKTNLAARVEYYNDKNGVIISSGTPSGFKTWGYSINYDYLLSSNAVWRIEARGFSSKDQVFVKNAQPISTNFFMSTSIAIAF
jgi:hypothetical protein